MNGDWERFNPFDESHCAREIDRCVESVREQWPGLATKMRDAGLSDAQIESNRRQIEQLARETTEQTIAKLRVRAAH